MEASEIKQLVDKLNYYTKLYDEGHPEISDKEWDDMYFKLQAIEKETGVYLPDSPTQGIPYEVKNKLNKVEHDHPMLSLDKTKSLEDVASFLSGKEWIAMDKMDGLTCSLTYIDGKLVKAETRGNGLIGEDVLHNALQVKNIPNRIDSNSRKVVVDGEIICTQSNFYPFAEMYKNPRNFASGSIRLLDSEECRKRNLSFVAWDCIEGTTEKTLSDKLMVLKMWNFTTVPFQYGEFIEDPIDELQHCVDALQSYSKELGYPIDGIVFKYNDVNEYLRMGRTDHHFKGGIAYKFYDEEEITTLKDIEWTMGRTGVLTPVAILEPIEIDGTEVSRASLHNLSILNEFEQQGLRIGCKVAVFKANMIIPQIARVVSENPDLDFTSQEFGVGFPSICPICGGRTEIKQDNDSKMLYCGNPDCEGKLLNKFDHFCSKKGLDIKGLSKATLEKLMDWGWLNNYNDIYILTLHRDEWIKKPGFGVASVDKILKAIEDSRFVTLDKVIAAAGIPEIGTRVAKDLAQHYNTWNDFRAETNFLKISGIGDVMNDNLLNFDYDNLLFERCVQEQFIWEDNKGKYNIENNNLDLLVGKVFCITGKVHIFKNRAELQADIENKGGRVVGSMSSKVNYLINNDNTSTSAKNKAAQAAGIPILTEEEYLSMCE